MKPNTCLVVDVWEGQLEIDEAVLKANGVAGIGIRLNDMNGGHHMDTGFTKQWNEAANFVRFPYFVYNPWVNGAANFTWLRDHLPPGVTTVAADIEVRYTNYPPSTYASEVAKFLALCQARGLKIIIYTGQWFLSYLSSWPRIDYWWAQYPDPATYFGGVKTWDELKLRLDRLDKPFNAAAIPGTLKMWQFSGDYLLLPGNNRDMDVNIFYGNETELAAYFGTSVPEPKPEEPKPEPATDLYYIMDDVQAMRIDPTLRPYNRGIYGYPSTVPLLGGKGTVLLPTPWMHYAYEINKPYEKYQFDGPDVLVDAKGWHNNGAPNLVRQLTFSGNIIRKRRLEGTKMYVQTVSVLDVPPTSIVKPGLKYLHTLINLFTTQHLDYLDISTGGRYPLIIVMSNPGEELYLDSRQLMPYYQIKFNPRVTASIWLNVRAYPGLTAKIVGKKLYGTTPEVYGYVTLGNDIWGRVEGGWIALKIGSYYYTTWRQP